MLRLRHLSSGLIAASASWLTPAVVWAAEEADRELSITWGPQHELEVGIG